jgi:nucleoid-associated protein YgaU
MAATGGTARADDVLLLVLAWVGVLLAAWLALGCLLGLAALLPGTAGRVAGQVAERVTPVAVRKALTLVLGASVGSMALPPAAVSSAGTGPSARDAGGRASPAARELSPGYTPTDLTPGYAPTSSRTPAPAGRLRSTPGATLPALPDLTVGAGPGYVPTPTPAPPGAEAPPPPSALTGPGYVPTRPAPVHDADRSRLLAPTPRPAASAHDLVTVRRGDSLWAIAARHLGPGASDAQVAHEWPRWYAANRDVVGADPDLLVPGLQLRPPSSTPPAPAAAASRSTSPHPSVTHLGVGSGAAAEPGARR